MEKKVQAIEYLDSRVLKPLTEKLDAGHDAYWTLSNGKELAMGGLSVSLRDYIKINS